MTDLNFNSLRLFIAVIEAGSFTKAADKLGVSRSHLSKQIKKLEEELQSRLILRSTRSLVTTEFGKALYQASRDSFTNIQELIELEQVHARDVRGHIKINTIGETFGENILTPIIAEFCVTHPNVSITTDFNSVHVNLIDDEYDLIIRAGVPEDSSFVAKKIMEYKLVTVASPNFLSQIEKIKHPEDLMTVNCLTCTENHWKYRKKTSGEELDIPIRGSFSCESGRSLFFAAKNHLGVTRIAELYCKEALQEGSLQEILTTWSSEPVPVYALYYSRRLQPRRLKLFIDFLAKRLN